MVACGQPCLLVGDFNVEPTKIPCLAKGISAGLSVDFEEAWALAAGLHPAPTCKRAGFSLIGGSILTLRFVLFLTMVGGSPGLRSLFVVHTFGLPLGCLLWTRLGVPSRLRFEEFGRFMLSVFSLCLVRMPLCLMILLIGMMFLWLGLFGLGC